MFFGCVKIQKPLQKAIHSIIAIFKTSKLHMNYKHIIWDWNGTLLDDRWLCVESINTLLKDRGKGTLSDENYLSRAGFDFTVEDFKVPALQFIDLYNKRRKECGLQENALKVLKHFKHQGISQSLLSASEAGVLNDMVDHYDLRDYFNEVAGLNNHYAASKLDLGVQLIKDLGIPSEKILMIGDTRHDQEVAQALGVDIILYDQGHFPAYRLESCGCRIISDLQELIAL